MMTSRTTAQKQPMSMRAKACEVGVREALNVVTMKKSLPEAARSVQESLERHQRALDRAKIRTGCSSPFMTALPLRD